MNNSVCFQATESSTCSAIMILIINSNVQVNYIEMQGMSKHWFKETRNLINIILDMSTIVLDF